MKFEDETETTELKNLTDEEIQKLLAQDRRLISPFQAQCFENQAKKYWDLFYKRNENRFFKDRHWTTREFQELANFTSTGAKKRLLEVGCGTGSLVYPLLEEGLDYEVWLCDISPRALKLVQAHPLYNPQIVHPFETDITRPGCFEGAVEDIDLVTCVFVLSTLEPGKVRTALGNCLSVLRPGGLLLIRDYARWDMAQLRFAPGRKISDNFYARQDGTRSYFFTLEELDEQCCKVGFDKISSVYIRRRTVNKKEAIDVPRHFVQAKYRKP